MRLASVLDVDPLDHDIVDRLVRALCLQFADRLHDVIPVSHLTEDRVFAIQPRGFCDSQEELTPIGPWAGVRHREPAGLVERRTVWRALVLELVAWPASPAPHRVAALDHETVDHAVKDRSRIQRRLSSGAAPRVGPG